MWKREIDFEHYTYNNGTVFRNKNNHFNIDEVVFWLKKHPKIFSVEISFAIIQNGGIEKLKNICSVSTLIISPNSKMKMGKVFFSEIATNANLKKLCLEFCNIGDSGLMEIAKSKTILELEVANCNISDDGVSALEHNKVLKRLHISDNNITDYGVGFLIKNSTIVEIDLSNNKIRDDTLINDLEKSGKVVVSTGIPWRGRMP